MSSEEYFEAAEKVNNLINDYSHCDNVTDVLKRSHEKIINLAKSKSIIKIASAQEEKTEDLQV